MNYANLLKQIALESGLTIPDVAAVMKAFPVVLAELDPGVCVRTPLGTFKCVERKRRVIVTPDGTESTVRPGLIVRLRPGSKLRLED